MNLASSAANRSSIRFTIKYSQNACTIRSIKLILPHVSAQIETLNIPNHRISNSEPLATYGLDSILVVQLTNTLRAVFEDISSTLFFEYQTIDALTDHLIKTHKDSLIRLTGLEERQQSEKKSADSRAPAEPAPMHPRITFRKTSPFPELDDFQTAGSESGIAAFRDIAIIGLAGRYPQANSVNELWHNLKAGKNCITQIPSSRWDWKKYNNAEKGKIGPIYTKWGGFIEDIDKFDASFFHISPLEAERMNPRERLFLEEVWACIEDAGYTPATLCDSGKVGVFVGLMNSSYPTGARYWSVANRISWLLNFKAPSIAVDTACSSSLTAIHLALESLYNGTSECAIAGGVNLITAPAHYLRLSVMTMLSAGDQCRSFGDQADGFVDGEGVGALVLKPYQKALADGDHIYGIIKGSMINTGGKTNGYTVPNPKAQSEVISEALQRAKINARTLSYIEAHGTGTALGDPVEIEGLTQAFRKHTDARQFCALGSAKSNIGHCESAAGIAGVTKVLLQLKHRQLVPSLHSERLNPNIAFDNTPFTVQQKLTAWNRPRIEIDGIIREYPRIAGISSFGAGGANAHMIIEEYIPADREQAELAMTPPNPAIILLSARNEPQLMERVRQLLATVEGPNLSDTHLFDVAYTLQVGREAMEERLGLIVSSLKALEEKLKDFVEDRDDIEDLYRGRVKSSHETLEIFTADEVMREAIDKWIRHGTGFWSVQAIKFVPTEND